MSHKEETRNFALRALFGMPVAVVRSGLATALLLAVFAYLVVLGDHHRSGETLPPSGIFFGFLGLYALAGGLAAWARAQWTGLRGMEGESLSKGLRRIAGEMLALIFLLVILMPAPLIWAVVPLSDSAGLHLAVALLCFVAAAAGLWFGARAALLIPHMALGNSFDFDAVMQLSRGRAAYVVCRIAPALAAIALPSLVAWGLGVPLTGISVFVVGVLTLAGCLFLGSLLGLVYASFDGDLN